MSLLVMDCSAQTSHRSWVHSGHAITQTLTHTLTTVVEYCVLKLTWQDLYGDMLLGILFHLSNHLTCTEQLPITSLTVAGVEHPSH